MRVLRAFMSGAYKLIAITSLAVTSLFFIGCNPKGAIISIAITPEKPSIDVEAAQQFVATASYSNSSNEDVSKQVTWTSANTNIATISASGLATAVNSGSANISGILNGASGNTELTVNSSYKATDTYQGFGDQVFIHTDFAGAGKIEYKLSLGIKLLFKGNERQYFIFRPFQVQNV